MIKGHEIAVLTLSLALAGRCWGAPGYEEIEVVDGGTISGVVKLTGKAPEMVPIGTTKDQDYCGDEIPRETHLIGSDGAIRNVVVSLEDVTRGKRKPTDPVVINNQGCRFSPHVLVAVTEGTVEVTNRDPVLHNTHAYFRKRTLFNMGLPVQGMTVPKKLRRRPGLVEVKCDAHEWMRAYIVVREHPYVAVTDSAGAYTLTDVPPGTYRLLAWHESLGTRESEIAVSAKEAVTANFVLAASE